MGAEFTLYDYQETDGTNAIKTWLLSFSFGLKAKAKFDNIIYGLQATKPGQGQWKRPLFDTMHGDCQGLFELRAQVRGVQLRLIGFFQERQATLVFGAIEKDNKLEPLSACQQAQERRLRVLANPDRHRRLHDFGTAARNPKQPGEP